MRRKISDLAKMIRFDFLTAAPLGMGAFLFSVLVVSGIGGLISPVACAWLVMAVMVFVIPLQSSDKERLGQLYGTLPVERKTITRARFLYITLVFLGCQLVCFGLIAVMAKLRLCDLLPGNGETIRLLRENFGDTSLAYAFNTGASLFFCVLFSYMEMMGQLFGRENEIKILAITLGVFLALLFGVIGLTNAGILPVMTFDLIETATGFSLRRTVISDLALLVIGTVFGEITASRVAKREL